MSQLKIPELSLSPESDDLTEENWFSSPTTSFDGSSINSIPWAEDVIKQNQEEWNRLERMFYGEEKLPADEKLRNEILEWTGRFPHLRIVGEQAAIYYDPNALPTDSSHEEVFAVHPHQDYGSKSARPQNMSRESNDIFPKHYSSKPRTQRNAIHSNTTNTGLEVDLEKCLRITSGPLLTKRSINNGLLHFYKLQKTPANVICENSSSLDNDDCMNSTASMTLRSRPSTIFSGRISRMYVDTLPDVRITPLTFSARLLKMPAIPINENRRNFIKSKLYFEYSPSDKNSTTSGREDAAISYNKVKRPFRNSITLPSINLIPTFYAQDLSTPGRSISAFSQMKHRSELHLPCKSATKNRPSDMDDD